MRSLTGPSDPNSYTDGACPVHGSNLHATCPAWYTECEEKIVDEYKCPNCSVPNPIMAQPMSLLGSMGYGVICTTCQYTVFVSSPRSADDAMSLWRTPPAEQTPEWSASVLTPRLALPWIVCRIVHRKRGLLWLANPYERAGTVPYPANDFPYSPAVICLSHASEIGAQFTRGSLRNEMFRYLRQHDWHNNEQVANDMIASMTEWNGNDYPYSRTHMSRLSNAQGTILRVPTDTVDGFLEWLPSMALDKDNPGPIERTAFPLHNYHPLDL